MRIEVQDKGYTMDDRFWDWQAYREDGTLAASGRSLYARGREKALVKAAAVAAGRVAQVRTRTRRRS